MDFPVYVYLRYDHSAGPGPRADEYIGPFDDDDAAARFKDERFSPDAPVTVVELHEPPFDTMTMTPEAAARYQDARE